MDLIWIVWIIIYFVLAYKEIILIGKVSSRRLVLAMMSVVGKCEVFYISSSAYLFQRFYVSGSQNIILNFLHILFSWITFDDFFLNFQGWLISFDQSFAHILNHYLLLVRVEQFFAVFKFLLLELEEGGSKLIIISR